MDIVLVKMVISWLIGLFITATILYVIRILRGPTIPDMVLAVDALAYDLAVMIIALAFLLDSAYLAVAALPLVLWAYILDMYVAKYLEKRGIGD